MIPATTVAEIRDRTDIVAIVAEHVQLRRSGTNHQGLCPFHAEKSPSFTVSAAKQFFYCFGCQKSGDVFRFLMDLTGKSFVDVVRELAALSGVMIPQSEPENPRLAKARPDSTNANERKSAEASTLRSRLLRLNDLSTRFFEAELRRSEPAQRYLEERGVAKEMVARFRLGYAPDAWEGLLRLFAEKRVPHELAEAAGLLIRREQSSALPVRAVATAATHYDRFRDRIMFPLLAGGGGAGMAQSAQTAAGDVIAFGGRTLPSAREAPGAKYINSPETPLYRKGDHLFGMHAARDAIRKRRQVILVEGNFDVIALHQHGLDNTVAPMGTALTETQVRLLSRLIGEDGHVVLMLDGDRAGRSATMKDIFLFSEANLRDVALLSGRDVDVRVARLPDGEDPDTFAHRDASGLEHAVRTAQPAIDYVVDEAIAKAEHQSVSGRVRVLERVAPLLAGLRNRTAQELHVDRIASALGMRAELMWRHLSSANQEAKPAPAQPGQAPQTPQRAEKKAPSKNSLNNSFDALTQTLVSLISDHPQLLLILNEEVLDSLENPVLSELLHQACEQARSGRTFGVEKLIELAPEEFRPAVAAAAMAGKFVQSEHPEQELVRIGQNIRARAIQREVRDLTQHMIRSQRTLEPAANQSICQRIQELNQLRAEILAMNGQMEKDDVPPVQSADMVAGDIPR